MLDHCRCARAPDSRGMPTRLCWSSTFTHGPYDRLKRYRNEYRVKGQLVGGGEKFNVCTAVIHESQNKYLSV
jgi:hypothetical protein